MTVKVVKMYTPRKVGKSSVATCDVKDTFGKGAKISVWNELINKVKTDNILLFENLRVNNYPFEKPHHIKTTAATVITNKTEALEEEFKDISNVDGQILGKVEVFHDVYCYFSCGNCSCSIGAGATYCMKCKKNCTAKKDFKYEILIKKPDGKCDGGVGFLRSLNLDDEDVKSDKEMVEDLLNERFVGKDVVVEYNFNKKDNSKMVDSIKFE